MKAGRFFALLSFYAIPLFYAVLVHFFFYVLIVIDEVYM